MHSNFNQLRRSALLSRTQFDYANELPTLKCLGLSWHRGLAGVSANTQKLLDKQAITANLPAKIKALFQGDIVNHSEQRPALHMALRAKDPATLLNPQLANEVRATRNTFNHWVNALHDGKTLTGETIKDIVHIGIGGSDLGPRLLLQAFGSQNASKQTPKIHFLSAPTDQLPQNIDPETTLVIVVSKSFSTVETLHNLALFGAKYKHKLAVTANLEAAQKMGFTKERILPLWSWVGGRFAICSSVSLSAAAVMGIQNWQAFLEGAAAMDQHASDTTLTDNLPIQLALLDFWHHVVRRQVIRAVFNYTPNLDLIASWLQQLETESNGKSVDQQHKTLNTLASPVVLGGNGINAQHAFFQNLHQGQTAIPIEFIGSLPDATKPASWLHYDNLLAQMQTLHTGAQFVDQPWRSLAGGRPVSAIILKRLDAYTLGALLCAYEHKTFCFAALVGCNPFDQWGVEAGKKVARDFAKGKSSDLPSINKLQKLATKENHNG